MRPSWPRVRTPERTPDGRPPRVLHWADLSPSQRPSRTAVRRGPRGTPEPYRGSPTPRARAPGTGGCLLPPRLGPASLRASDLSRPPRRRPPDGPPPGRSGGRVAAPRSAAHPDRYRPGRHAPGPRGTGNRRPGLRRSRGPLDGGLLAADPVHWPPRRAPCLRAPASGLQPLPTPVAGLLHRGEVGRPDDPDDQRHRSSHHSDAGGAGQLRCPGHDPHRDHRLPGHPGPDTCRGLSPDRHSRQRGAHPVVSTGVTRRLPAGA